MKKQVIIILLIGAFCSHVQAQDREVARNNDLWFLQLSKFYFENGFGLENELHLRLADWGGEKQQILIRPSVFFTLNDAVTFHLGYTHIETYPYGEQAIAIRTPENNLWAQVTLNHEVVGLQVAHRYRLEERWTGKVINTAGQPEIDGSLHRNRFRYRFTLKKSLSDKTYLAAFNEVWINFGENTGLNRLDQNWIYIGAGHKINKSLAIELGYLHQWLAKADGNHFESNNTIQLTAHLKISQAKTNIQ
jgi:hypothetical protein